MKAVFLDFATMGPGLDIDTLQRVLPGLQIFDVTTDEQIPERIEGAEFVLGNKSRITNEHMQANPQLRYIGLTATGTDNIDLLAAAANDICVCNIQAYCAESVAEHVFGCLLYLTRSLERYNSTVRDGDWQKSDGFCLLSYPIRELCAMTLGIVGHGNLGQRVARMGGAFGMNVIISARPGSDEVGAGRVPFDELLRCCNVISLHCPLNDETADLFGKEEFALMRSDAILVNTARGGLIDSTALLAALESGQIGAAAIDVLPEEPPVNGDPLLDYTASNLVITPHVAWASDKARQAAIDQLADCVSAFLAGKPVNRVI